jgi:L-threonylcarbamoyladenylate synthase
VESGVEIKLVKTPTIRLQTVGDAADGDLTKAAEILRDGGLVAFPTETVYGLGANAFDAGAVAKIFEAKQRPKWDPLIVHVSDREMLERVAEVPAWAERLIDIFWPGPLTLLLPRRDAVPDSVTAGRPLVGVRMPAHPVARALIEEAGVPIAAPSANLFGHTSPTSAEHVLQDLDGRIDAVLDGGATTLGLESTVAGWMGDRLLVYRQGGVTVEQLVAMCGASKVEVYRPPASRPGSGERASMPSPGVGIRHYAPRARLHLVSDVPRLANPQNSLLSAIQSEEAHAHGKVGAMLPEGWTAQGALLIYRWGAWTDGEMLARRLFAGLRELDEAGASVIVCPVPDIGGIGAAIRDRLEKGARAKWDEARQSGM